jgi:hypothetical protein
MLDLYYSNSPDYWMREQLQFAGALAAFANGEKTTAFNTFHGLLNATDTKTALYNGYLGRMSLSSAAPRLALDHFENAIRHGNRGVYQEYAFALTEAGAYEKAGDMWKQLGKSEDENARQLAGSMEKILTANNIKDMLGEDPLTKYNFIRYRSGDMDTTEMNGFILSMEDNNFQAACWLDLVRKALDTNKKEAAAEYMRRLDVTPFNNPFLLTAYRQLIVLMKIKTGEAEELQALLNKFDNQDKELRPFIDVAQAWLTAQSGASQKADRLFHTLGIRDPFFEAAVLEAAKYFSKVKGDEQTAYELLLNASNINVYSPKIQEAYILQCLRIGMVQYAEEAMNGLKGFASNKELEDFIPFYQKMKSEIEKRQRVW